MSDPNDHATSIALLNHKFSTLEASLLGISRALEKLTNLEMHHQETRHAITRLHEVLDGLKVELSARVANCEVARKNHEERLRALEDAAVARAGLAKSMGWLWGAMGGLMVIEVWRYLGGA